MNLKEAHSEIPQQRGVLSMSHHKQEPDEHAQVLNGGWSEADAASASDVVPHGPEHPYGQHEDAVRGASQPGGVDFEKLADSQS
jgi:hypothetical protein